MSEKSDLSKIAARCHELSNSPYLRRELPAKLEKLRAVLTDVNSLTKQDVPALIAEIKQLRSRNDRLQAELSALNDPSLHTPSGTDLSS